MRCKAKQRGVHGGCTSSAFVHEVASERRASVFAVELSSAVDKQSRVSLHEHGDSRPRLDRLDSRHGGVKFLVSVSVSLLSFCDEFDEVLDLSDSCDDERPGHFFFCRGRRVISTCLYWRSSRRSEKCGSLVSGFDLCDGVVRDGDESEDA